jgi:hypothetical protein
MRPPEITSSVVAVIAVIAGDPFRCRVEIYDRP